MVRRWLTRVAVAVACLAFVAYAADFISVRYTIPKGRAVYGSVQVNKYLAVPLKNGKDEYDFVGSEDMVCTNSIFPQLGYTPCWWVRRHRERREEL